METIPVLSGAKNQSGYGRAIPLVLGRHQLTPYYCGSPYRTISGTDGEKQTFHALYMLGYNDVQVTDIKLGMIDLAYNRDYVKNGQTVTCPTVDEGDIIVNGRWDASDYNIHLELRQGANGERSDGEVDLYPEKVVEEQLNIELLKVDESENRKVLVGYDLYGYLYTNPFTFQLYKTFVTLEEYELIKDDIVGYLREKSGKNSINKASAVERYESTSDVVKSNGLVCERFSAKNPHIIEVEFTLNGLVKYDDKGNPQDKSVAVKIEMSLDGGNTYEPFARIIGDGITYDAETGTSTITRNKNKVMRFVARRELLYNEAINCTNRIAELRIQKMTPKDNDSNVSDSIYLSGIRTWCYDYTKSKATENDPLPVLIPQAPVIESRRNMTARLAIQIDADELEFKNQIDELNVIITSKAKTWDGNDWSIVKSPTNNPASLMLMVLEHSSRGKYRYDSGKIDYQQIGEFYEWCNQPRVEGADSTPKYQCNGVLTNTKRTREIIDNILSTARAKLILDDKKYSVWIDKPRNTPVMVLNNQNVLSASNSKSFKDLPDGYKIKFINEITWQTDELKVLRDGVTEDTPNLTYESIEIPFVTDAKQIYQNGRYLYACAKLRQEVWSRKVSVDGNLIDIGSLVELQDDTISVGIGDGAEIKSVTIVNGNIISINTDGNMYVDDLTKRYGVKVTCADGVHEPKVMTWEVEITQAGEQSNFVFVNPIPVTDTYKPNAGDIVSFGFYELEATQGLCFGKKDNGDGTFDLTLVPYQAGVYSADSGTIPEFDSKVCDIPQRGGGTYQIDQTKEAVAKLTERTIEIINDFVETGLQPYIYASINSAGLYVDSNNVTTQEQKLSILCHVIIANEEREFTIGEISAPTGWVIDVDYHTVNVTIPEGTKVTQGGFNIPIRYREIFEDATLVDEDATPYADEGDRVYHTYRLGDEIITYDLPFSYVGVKGGNYKGKFNSIRYNNNDVPVAFVLTEESVEKNVLLFTDCVAGDYITWTGTVLPPSGETLYAQLVKGGILRTSRLYKYCGTHGMFLWEEDTDQTHTMNAMTDVMSVLDDELGQNKNNSAEQYLAKLVSNDIFADRLIANTAFVESLVSSEAFIDKLATRIITLQQGGQIKSYWADCVYTEVEVDGNVTNIYNSFGLWKSFENIPRRIRYSFSCVDTETDTPENLSYSSTITVEELNANRYLYIRIENISGIQTHESYNSFPLTNPYFKLDADTGKITARDMEAEGGQFHNINAIGGTFDLIEALDMTIKGNSKFAGELDCGSLQVKKSIKWTTVKTIARGSDIYERVFVYFNNLATQAGVSIFNNFVPIESLFPSFDYVKGYYGSTKIINIKLATSHISQPFSAEAYHVYFNSADIDLLTYIGQSVEPSTTDELLTILGSDGTTLAFLLEELPSTRPDEPNFVYCGNDGILRLS